MALALPQKEYIIGFLLGDSSVERNGKNCRIRFDHSVKQLKYLQWKHTILAPYSGKLSTYARFDERLKKLYPGCRFYTLSKVYFNFYMDLFYKNGEKQMNENIGQYLTPLALTSWFLVFRRGITEDKYFHTDPAYECLYKSAGRVPAPSIA